MRPGKQLDGSSYVPGHLRDCRTDAFGKLARRGALMGFCTHGKFRGGIGEEELTRLVVSRGLLRAGRC
jgi:hypothetical protein